MEVDTLTFIGDFDNNQLAAEEKYKDKKVKMTAYIKNISEDIGGAISYRSLQAVINIILEPQSNAHSRINLLLRHLRMVNKLQ